MLDQKEITVHFSGEPKQFVIQQLPSSRGMQVHFTLMQIVAGAADGVGFTTSNDLLDTPVNIGAVLAGMVKRLDPVASPTFIKRVILESVITPKLKDDDFESQFSGEYDALFELFEKIIEHNNFVEALKKRLEAAISSWQSGGEGSPEKSTPST